MSEWEENLYSVFNGGIEMARIGRIPRILAKAISSSTTIVRLSKSTAKKIRSKHHVTFAELRHLGVAFHEGNVARDGKLTLAFWFESPDAEPRTIKAIIKASSDGTDIFLKTMHPIAKHRLKALKAKTMMLRERPGT